jgi:hypothetical protein
MKINLIRSPKNEYIKGITTDVRLCLLNVDTFVHPTVGGNVNSMPKNLAITKGVNQTAPYGILPYD